jgi:hypothetical protein
MQFFQKELPNQSLREHVVMLLSSFLSGHCQSQIHLWSGLVSFRLVKFMGEAMGQYATMFPTERWNLQYKMSCRGQRFGYCLSDPVKIFEKEVGYLKRLSSGEKVIPLTRKDLYDYVSQLKIVIPLHSPEKLNLSHYGDSLEWRLHKLHFPKKIILKTEMTKPEEDTLLSCKEALLYFLIKNYKTFEE